MKTKIQSVSDLITNSSSEVFVMYTRSGIKELKKVVGELLGIDFDDKFSIEIETNNDYLDEYEEREEQERDLSFKDWCLEHCYDANDYEGYPAVLGISINAKDPKDARAAELISTLPLIFESEERYC